MTIPARWIHRLRALEEARRAAVKASRPAREITDDMTSLRSKTNGSSRSMNQTPHCLPPNPPADTGGRPPAWRSLAHLLP